MIKNDQLNFVFDERDMYTVIGRVLQVSTLCPFIISDYVYEIFYWFRNY